MKGFKDFLLRGNLIELAVAFIMASAFLLVVNATVQLIMDLLGALGGIPNFSSYTYRGVSFGAWLTAVVSFVLMSAVVYFVIVLPYTKARQFFERGHVDAAAAAPADIVLLTEIRDLLRARTAAP